MHPKLLSATHANASEEVLEIPSGFDVGLDWILWDNHGKRVPFKLFRDRTADTSGGRREGRSRLLLSGDRENYYMPDISRLSPLTSPGTYHVVVRRIVRRLEVSGERQITFSRIHIRNSDLKEPTTAGALSTSSRSPGAKQLQRRGGSSNPRSSVFIGGQ